MFGRTGKRDSAAKAAQGVAAAPPRHKLDPTDGFPRGLPDGDRDKPSASARWPSPVELAGTLDPWEPGMFLLGRDKAGRYYGHKDDRHVLTVAGSRAGKGVSLVIPNLLLWPGSALVIDPKGELATLTASRRSASGSPWAVPMTPGQGEVYALDPFERVTGDARQFAHAAFNPMAELDPATGPGLDLAYQIADALIIQSEGDGAHWTQGALALLRVLILYVSATEPPDSRNLITVRRLAMRGPDRLKELWDEMAAMTAPEHDLIARTGEAMQARSPGERGSILASIETQTAFLEGPQMARVLSGSSFKLEQLKEKRVTVYLCLPATRLATHGRWLRMFVTLAMDAMERTGPLREGQDRVLFCLDEFAALGTMPTVEKAAGQIASFGVKLWPIIQDLTQLKRDYRDAWETFMGNAGLLTFFGNTDLTTTEHIAKRLGETEVLRTVESANETWQTSEGGSRGDPITALLGQQPNVTTTSGINKGGGRSRGEQVQRTPLLHASEIVQAFARERGNILVMIPDKPPYALHRVAHFSEEDEILFGGLYGYIDGQQPPRVTRELREERDRARLVGQ